MTDEDSKPPVAVEEILAAAQSLAGERDAVAAAERFLATLQAWAAPSLVACVEKDPNATPGWRVLGPLTSGPTPTGFERSIDKLLGDNPQARSKPTLLRGEDVAGGQIKARDNWVVPWNRGASSGLLLLRGVPRPHPSNLGDAVALLSQALWPLFASDSPAVRLQRLAEAAESVSRLGEQLLRDVKAEQERLAAQAPKVDVAALEQSRATAEGERDAALAEALKVKERAAALESDLAEARGRTDTLEKERDEANTALAALRAQHDRLGEEASRSREEADRSREEASRLTEETGRLVREVDSARQTIDALEREASEGREARETTKRATQALDAALAELTSLRGQAQNREAELGMEVEQLLRTVESLQRDKTALLGSRKAAEQAQAASLTADEVAGRERERLRAESEEAAERARKAEASAKASEQRWNSAVASFREAFEAVRRTPFLPPALRVAIAPVEQLLDPEAGPRAKRPRVLFLDRDFTTLGGLAAELEAAGFEVLIAHYPEEVSFFLSTPSAQGLGAIVCDVMALRSDQPLSSLVRSWKDSVPTTRLLLSFKADVTTEAERVQRVPTSLTAGYLRRPLQRDTVVDAISGARPPSRA